MWVQIPLLLTKKHLTQFSQMLRFSRFSIQFKYNIQIRQTKWLNELTKIFLPKKQREKFKNYLVVLRSPHVHKKSQDQYFQRLNSLEYKTAPLTTYKGLRQTWILKCFLIFLTKNLKKKITTYEKIQFRSHY